MTRSPSKNSGIKAKPLGKSGKQRNPDTHLSCSEISIETKRSSSRATQALRAVGYASGYTNLGRRSRALPWIPNLIRSFMTFSDSASGYKPITVAISQIANDWKRSWPHFDQTWFSTWLPSPWFASPTIYQSKPSPPMSWEPAICSRPCARADTHAPLWLSPPTNAMKTGNGCTATAKRMPWAATTPTVLPRVAQSWLSQPGEAPSFQPLKARCGWRQHAQGM